MLLHDFFERRHRLSCTVSFRCLSPDYRCVEHIESFDASGACGVGGIAERCQRYHCIVFSPDEEKVQIFFEFPVRGFCLNVYPIDTVEHVEVVDVYRTGIRFHCGEYIGERNTCKFYFVAVDIEVELRYLGLQRRR